MMADVVHRQTDAPAVFLRCVLHDVHGSPPRPGGPALLPRLDGDAIAPLREQSAPARVGVLSNTGDLEAAMNLIRTAKRQVRKITARDGSDGGGTDILDTLKKEHEEVAAMLEDLVASDSGPARKKLVKQIKAALVPHLRAEEKVLYKSVVGLRDKQAKQDGEEGIIEHRLADKMLAGLDKAQSAITPQFSAAAKVLKELVQHHVEEEEREIWKDVKANFSNEDRIAMNHKFEAEKQRVRI
jgi:hypothetical protein